MYFVFFSPLYVYHRKSCCLPPPDPWPYPTPLPACSCAPQAAGFEVAHVSDCTSFGLRHIRGIAALMAAANNGVIVDKWVISEQDR